MTPVDELSAGGALYAQSTLPPPTAVYHLADAASEDAFIFTSSGAEAIQQVLLGVYTHVSRQVGRNHFLAGQLEEAPTILAMAHLEELGCCTERLSVSSDSVVSVDQVRNQITPRTALISLSAVNGVTGVIQPLESIAALCEERGILLHVEASHMLGKAYFSFRNSGVHFLTWDGAPLGAPPGTGGLLIRRGVELPPLLFGAKHQEGLRAGMIFRPLWEAFLAAASFWIEQGDSFCMKTAQLRYQLETGLQGVAQSTFGHATRVSHISFMQFPGVVSEMLCYWLAQRNIMTNMGGNQFQHLHHMLQACGVMGKEKHGGLSFALGWGNQHDEMERVIQEVRNGMTQFQMMSGVWS